MGKHVAGGGRKIASARAVFSIKPTETDVVGDAYLGATSPALTLPADIIGTHPSGWTVQGDVMDDYYQWVNDFSATHPRYGRVWGNFEDTVKASSQAAYNHFVKNHPPESWDYYDI